MNAWRLDCSLSLAGAIAAARHSVREAIASVEAEGKAVMGVVGLFSGGNDSTTLIHMLRGELTHLAHCNTGIGVEQTRQFVRDQANSWGLPLIEVTPPTGSTYRELVTKHGFPGPSRHFIMYRNLKERSLRTVRRRFVTDGRNQRVIFVGGIRRAESLRRRERELRHDEGSVVWLSPLIDWTDEMMAEYRLARDVPHNEVSDMLHMSGECLCGAYADRGELDEIEFFFPSVGADIRALEAEVVAAGIAEPHCRWGWGAYRDAKGRKHWIIDQFGESIDPQLRFDFDSPLCTSCDFRDGEA